MCLSHSDIGGLGDGANVSVSQCMAYRPWASGLMYLTHNGKVTVLVSQWQGREPEGYCTCFIVA